MKEDGEPESPKQAVTKMVNFCGALVRDNVPLSVHRWRSNNANDPNSFPQRQKDLLWDEVKTKFTLPPEPMKRK